MPTISGDMTVIELTAKASKKAMLELDKDGILHVLADSEMVNALEKARKSVERGGEVVAVLDTYFNSY